MPILSTNNHHNEKHYLLLIYIIFLSSLFLVLNNAHSSSLKITKKRLLKNSTTATLNRWIKSSTLITDKKLPIIAQSVNNHHYHYHYHQPHFMISTSLTFSSCSSRSIEKLYLKILNDLSMKKCYNSTGEKVEIKRIKRATFTIHNPSRQLPLLTRGETRHFLSLFYPTIKIRNITDQQCLEYYICRVFDIAAHRNRSYLKLADIELALLDVFGVVAHESTAFTSSKYHGIQWSVPRTYYEGAMRALRGETCLQAHRCQSIPEAIAREKFDKIWITNRFVKAHQKYSGVSRTSPSMLFYHRDRYNEQVKRKKIERYQVGISSTIQSTSIK